MEARTSCFRCPFCLHPSEERLALTEACVFTISVLRSRVRAFSPLGGATFSSHESRAAGPAHLPLVRGTAVHFNDYGRKDSAVHCFQDRISMQTRPYTPSCVGPRLPLCFCSGHTARSRWSKPFSSGRAGFRLLPLLPTVRNLASDTLVAHVHCAVCHCPPGIGGHATFSLIRRAGKRSGRRRRRHTARRRRTHRGCSRSSCSCVPLLLRPFCGWWLCYRRYTLRVVPGGYVRRRLLCPFSSWPCHCRQSWRRWRTPFSWRSRRSLRRACDLHGGAAIVIIITCAALACIGARFSFPVSMCSTVTLSLVGVCLASLSRLADLVTICWLMSRSLLPFGFSSPLSGAFLCRYIRSLHAMLPQTSLSYLGRASCGPNSPEIGGFTCTAVSGSFRRPKAEGCRGFHNLDSSRSNGVFLRHSCGEGLWT